MVSRTTDDYETLAKMGCVAMSEPAFWAGFDRGSVESFRDYFRQLTDFEPKRAAQYGIQHFTWLCINAKEAENVAGQIFDIVGFPMNFTTGSIFVGAQFEVLKRQYLGTHGHIAIGTNSIERAIAYLNRKGIGIRPETKNEKDGKLQTVYLDVEIGGFAIHLAQV